MVVFRGLGIYVHGSKLLGRQRKRLSPAFYSKYVLWGDEEEGLIPVSDEADDMEAPA